LGTPRRHEPRAPLARPGQGERSARTACSGLRLVYGGLRHARSERGEGVAGGAGSVNLAIRGRLRISHARTREETAKPVRTPRPGKTRVYLKSRIVFPGCTLAHGEDTLPDRQDGSTETVNPRAWGRHALFVANAARSKAALTGVGPPGPKH